MNSAPALDDYLMELLSDAGAVAAPARPAPAAVVSPPLQTDEAIAVARPGDGIEAGAADPAMVASIIEEMEREFAAPPQPQRVPAARIGPAVESRSVAAVAAATDLAQSPDALPMPPRAVATAAAPAPAPVLRSPPPASGSPAMTLLSPIAAPKALPPLPAKPFLQPPIEGGARRRAAEPTTRWLRMRCDEQHYALELLKVQEVVLPGALLPLRGAARHMLGVMNLRGQVVPVLDLGLYLGRRAIEPDASTRIVVLEELGEILGLRVSAVEDVTNLTEQQIEPPDNARVGRIANHLFRGVARLHARAVILLDASQLLK
jgi:purine-binding chemotaxis protein CheW